MQLLITLLVLVTFSPTAYATALCDETKQILQQGDILFLGVKTDPLGVYKNIGKVHDTWVNHVGIAFFENGEWVVKESTWPKAKTGPLCRFVKRAKPGKFAVKRVRSALSSADIRALSLAAEARRGYPYDLGFDFDDSESQYCSKYIYEVFQYAMRLEVGSIQTIRELFNQTKNREEKIRFWRRWFGGRIPWDRRVVVPYSQYSDPDLITVLDKSLLAR